MSGSSVPAFRLRFPLAEVGCWADRYQYADDAEVELIGKRAGQTGWYTLADLLNVARWKTRGRSVHFCEENSDSLVRRARALALATSDERERIAALVALRGVRVPTASVLLHLALGDAFPIVDYRALWSLSVDEPPAAYSFDYWWGYVETCRSLRARADLNMRTFDRGLWQFSKEHQPPRSSRGAPYSHPMPRPDRGSGPGGRGSWTGTSASRHTSAWS